MDWDNPNAKRFGIACFTDPNPEDPEGYGDASQFFNDIDEANAWIQRAIKAGRFKFFTLWDWAGSGDWVWVGEFSALKPRKRKG